MREVVLVSSVRTPVGRAFKGTLRATRPDELAAFAIKAALARVPQLDPKEIEDVILGCAMPEAEQGMNVARIASLRAGLPVEVSAVTINRFCSSGLQAIAMAAERIMSGAAEVMIAGGTESMSMIPMGGNKISPNPWLVDHYPDAYLSMGLTAERVATRFGITRAECDEFSLRSHQKALAAIAAGNFDCPSSRDRNHPKRIEAQDAGNPVQNRRMPPRRHFTRCACRAESSISRQRRDYRRKFIADVGRRRCGDSHVSRPRASTRHQASRPLCFFRHGRIQAGRNGTGTRLRHSESAQDRRPETLRHRRDRTQRSLRGPIVSRNQRSRTRSRPRQSQRRSHRFRPSLGMHRRQANSQHNPRTKTPKRTLRHGHNVRRRRYGRRRHFRKPELVFLRVP